MPVQPTSYDVNPDHHLWRNGRFWWVAFTLIHDGWRQERVRRSLKTADVAEARRRRDAIFATVCRRRGGRTLAAVYAGPAGRITQSWSFAPRPPGA